MPGLTPTFSDTVRVLINEALAARAAASPTAASPTAASPTAADILAAHGVISRIYEGAVKAHDAAGLADFDPARAAALRAFLDDTIAADPARAAAHRAELARNAAARVPASRGAGGITLHRATNGASIATVVANDPK
jgi:hypothetical protein